MQRNGTAGRGFTLLELLTVVAILAVLIGILIPAVGAARTRARKVETTNLLHSLMTDCEAYSTNFNGAYPGPASNQQVAGGALTGTQNLLLGLTYAMYGNTSPNGVAMVDASPALSLPGGAAPLNGSVFVDMAKPTGPIDYSSQDPNGNYRKMSAFFTPNQKQLSPSTPGSSPAAWSSAGMNGSVGGAWAFPTIVDTFPEGLPILYYRKNVGIDGTATADSAGNVQAQSAPAIVSAAYTGTDSYCLADNNAYIGSSALQSVGGTTYNQQTKPLTANDLATLVSSTSGTTATARGGFVLIAAGPKRNYGRIDNGNDCIVVIGGH